MLAVQNMLLLMRVKLVMTLTCFALCVLTESVLTRQ